MQIVLCHWMIIVCFLNHSTSLFRHTESGRITLRDSAYITVFSFTICIVARGKRFNFFALRKRLACGTSAENSIYTNCTRNSSKYRVHRVRHPSLNIHIILTFDVPVAFRHLSLFTCCVRRAMRTYASRSESSDLSPIYMCSSRVRQIFACVPPASSTSSCSQFLRQHRRLFIVLTMSILSAPRRLLFRSSILVTFMPPDTFPTPHHITYI